MDTVDIVYRLTFKKSKRVEEFNFALDEKTFELVDKQVDNPPAWTELAYRQCPHCPLKPEDSPHCPMALQIHKIVDRLHDTKSIDEVEMEVVTDDRTVIATTAIQHALSSMLGLITPISGCPKTAYMRPLARFHVPMSSEEETVFRVAGMYLLAQYFLTHNGSSGKFAFDGLIQIYEDMHDLNKAVASRLQMATSSDSMKNAITLIDMYSTLIPMLLEDQLVEIRSFFSAYLPVGESEPVAPTQSLLEKARTFVSDMDASNLSLLPVEGVGEDDRPAWLRASEEGQKSGESAAGGPSAIDEILSKSSLSLSLEMEAPVEQERPRGRAVFNLPEDDLPTGKPGS
jgi:hypothetical protein